MGFDPSPPPAGPLPDIAAEDSVLAPKQAEQLFLGLLGAAPEPSLVVDPKGRIVAINPAVGPSLGLEVDGLSGRPMSVLLALLDAAAEVPGSASSAVAAALEPSTEGSREDLRARTFLLARPLSRWIAVRRRSLSVGATTIGSLWEFADVDAAARARAACEREARDARAALGELAAELAAAHARLLESEKMASLGMLITGIAHEINTPIGAVSSMHDTLVRAVDKLRGVLATECPRDQGADPKLTNLLKFIDDANRVIADGAGRVTTIVKRLRCFARLDDAELVEADINEGIDSTLQLVHHVLKQRIEVVRELGRLPRIACYPGRLNQVFLNLLMNAAQSIDGTGHIHVRTFADEDRIHVAITDTGCGIPKEHLDRIFDVGFTTKGIGEGTGLGLPISRQIMRDHHGTIMVESRVGAGTTFTVSLPRDLRAVIGGDQPSVATCQKVE
ncbi:MAG: hypothetical protein JW751_25610 [Polyangiaceae bacterium]|nr:hypothetical protein [Polyangiaceae bacterium]